MAGERGPMSEQQEEFEAGWGTTRSAAAPNTGGHQYIAPENSGEEPRAIADEAGSDYLLGPEDAAMHIEGDDGHPAE